MFQIIILSGITKNCFIETYNNFIFLRKIIIDQQGNG
jgi:hypothetical protein